MRIKRLELIGFKSFLEKTSLSFDVPITCIVGPNGCGKSNVVDALKWVTGELSYKELRGKTMEDLIFAGSELRPPTSMMEVHLTLDNEEGRAPAEYNKFSEINVLRRIFRDGTSDFFINKAACRLRDITDLFLDTGIGQSSYSIIEQGRVGAIVSSRPEDRRLIIEEAAGITKYKVRKREALRKIEHTKNNLLRVNDILKELQRQISTLNRQAEKAREYQEMKLALKTDDLNILSYDWNIFHAQLKELQREQSVLSENISKEDTDLVNRESQYEIKRAELLEIEKKLEKAQELLYQSRASVQNYEVKIKSTEEKVLQLTQSSQEDEKRSAELGEKLNQLNTEIEKLAQDAAQLETTKTELESKIQDANRIDQSHREKLTELERVVEQEKQKFTELTRKEDSINAGLQSIADKENEIKLNQESFKEKLSILSAQVESVITERGEKEKAFQETQQLCLSFEQDKASASVNLETLEKEEEDKRNQWVSLGNTLEGKRSRLQTLEEFISSYQGYEEGVRQIMSEKDKQHDKLKNIRDIFGNLLKVESGYERATESALSDYLDCIVVNRAGDALSAIDFLKNDLGEGRGSFIVDDEQFLNVSKAPTTADQTPDLPCLAQYVSASGPIEKWLNGILSQVFLVDTLAQAVSLWQSGHKFTFVCSSGEKLSNKGLISGGKWDEQNGVLEIRNQAETLEKEINKDEEVYRKLGAGIELLREEIESVKNRIKQLAQELTQQSELKVTFEKAFHSLQETEKFTREKQFELNERSEKLKKELEELGVQRAKLGNELSSLDKVKLGQESDLHRASDTLIRERDTFDRHNLELTQLKVTFASAQERLESYKREQELKSKQRVDSDAEKKMLSERSEQRQEEARALQEDLQAIEKSRAEEIIVLEEREESLTGIRNTHDTQAQMLREEEEQLKRLREGKEKLFSEVSRLQMNIQECEHKIARLKEQAFERYEEDLVKYVEAQGDIEAEAEEVMKWKRNLEKLQNKISRLGNVHLGAVDELKELNERFEFMNTQKNDLEESLRDLSEAIKKINETTIERLIETYHNVNEMFQELFPKLFRGGKAKLVMLDENNPLETGIDIVAQPPGKKLQNMNLLSGGEKALTAIALIFSIFKFKAPPFCILDEVDAPLDDANVGRFLNMVKEMSDKTQFIMITHNKASMEVGDNLYGVTMEEPGISRLVSVRVNETVEELKTQSVNAQVA